MIVSHIWDARVNDLMPFTKVDEKGRVVLPSELRARLDISPGDEFIIDELGPNALVLKKVDLRAMIEEIIEKAKGVDLDRLEEEIEEEANRLARKKYQILD
jgi:AbrB family transcriptional regulator (stage V sporulation protein T)